MSPSHRWGGEALFASPEAVSDWCCLGCPSSCAGDDRSPWSSASPRVTDGFRPQPSLASLRAEAPPAAPLLKKQLLCAWLCSSTGSEWFSQLSSSSQVLNHQDHSMGLLLGPPPTCPQPPLSPVLAPRKGKDLEKGVWEPSLASHHVSCRYPARPS